MEIMYCNFTVGVGWSKPVVISDDGTCWNTGSSGSADIAIDATGNISVVWVDYTPGVWGTDSEIMWTHRSNGAGWSKPIVISDGYNGSYWNTWGSFDPAIATGLDGVIHVVWDDVGVEYATYRPGCSWSNATRLSYFGYDPDIAVDGTLKVHVVWTEYITGSMDEILYRQWSPESGWGTIKTVSNDASNWNFRESWHSAVAVDASNGIHVVWEDETPGDWGYDTEIMYCKLGTQTVGGYNLVIVACVIGGIVLGVLGIQHRRRSHPEEFHAGPLWNCNLSFSKLNYFPEKASSSVKLLK